MIDANVEIARQKMAVILNTGYAFFVRNTLCDFTVNDENYNFHAWISVDPTAMWNQKGYVIRETLSGKLRKFVEKRTQKVSEGGFMTHLYQISRGLRVTLLSEGRRKNCSSEVIMIDANLREGEEDRLGNAQLRMLYCTCAVMTLLGIFALALEHKLAKDEEDAEDGVWMRQLRGVKFKRY